MAGQRMETFLQRVNELKPTPEDKTCDDCAFLSISYRGVWEVG